MKILYVEDNSANLFLVQRVARMGNHEVINYTEGQRALDNFEKDNPDLVLMDVQLPGKLNGLDVVKALRAAGHRTPIIAVTAYAMMGDKEKCMQAGCDDYLAKPMPVAELIEKLKRYEPKETPSGEKTSAGASTRPIAVQVVETPAASAAPAVEKMSAETENETLPSKPAGLASALAQDLIPPQETWMGDARGESAQVKTETP